jgi:crotonobetainyl-CoA:carnitine CoA-transferase CaiB-like acyl-CoA transferase
MTELPLSGIRVADFGWVFAIPHATQWLGALGADVIRVETALAPDIARLLGGTDGVMGINRSGVFNSINCSKKSIAVNLSRPEGREIARRLVRISDVVTENYTVGNMRKFGLTYEELRAIRPDIIMLSGTPLGQTGPYANAVGWGPTTQAFAGMCHLTGYPGGFPCGIGGTWPDFAIGVVMAFVLLTALHYRERTGEGQYIDLSMAETVSAMLPEAFMDYFLNWRDPGPIGNRDECIAPHGVFPTAGEDKWIAIAVATDEEFGTLCEALGVAQLALDARFAQVWARLHNVDALEAEIASRTRTFDRDVLVAKLRSRNLACGPVYSAEELMRDPTFNSSGMLVRLNHGESGERIVPGLPVRFSAIEPDYRPAPTIGQNTDEVLSELLGYSADEIARMREDNVLI